MNHEKMIIIRKMEKHFNEDTGERTHAPLVVVVTVGAGGNFKVESGGKGGVLLLCERKITFYSNIKGCYF